MNTRNQTKQRIPSRLVFSPVIMLMLCSPAMAQLWCFPLEPNPNPVGNTISISWQDGAPNELLFKNFGVVGNDGAIFNRDSGTIDN